MPGPKEKGSVIFLVFVVIILAALTFPQFIGQTPNATEAQTTETAPTTNTVSDDVSISNSYTVKNTSENFTAVQREPGDPIENNTFDLNQSNATLQVNELRVTDRGTEFVNFTIFFNGQEYTTEIREGGSTSHVFSREGYNLDYEIFVTDYRNPFVGTDEADIRVDYEYLEETQVTTTPTQTPTETTMMDTTELNQTIDSPVSNESRNAIWNGVSLLVIVGALSIFVYAIWG